MATPRNVQLEEEIGVLQKQLASAEMELGIAHAQPAALMGQLGAAFLKCGDLDDALGMLKESHVRLSAALGNGHAAVGVVANNLAQLMMKFQDFSAAKQYILQAIRIKERVHGPEHTSVVRARVQLGVAVPRPLMLRNCMSDLWMRDLSVFVCRYHRT